MDKKPKEFLKLKTYYDICDTTKKDNAFINNHPDTLSSYEKITSAINKNHLLVIDQTLSTVFDSINEEDFLMFKTKLKNSIHSTYKDSIPNKVKSLLYLKLIETFDAARDTACNNLFVYFYYGNVTNAQDFNFHNEWIQFNMDSVMKRIIDYENYTTKMSKKGKKLNQSTDFKTIFSDVEKKIADEKNKNKITFDCITFLSDFDHDYRVSTLLNEDFVQLKNTTKDTKINLIALWRAKENEEKEKSEKEFISKFKTYFVKVIHTEILHIDEYKNESFTGNSDFLEFREIITYKLPEYENYVAREPIDFWAEISNSLRYNDAEVKIVLDTKGKFRWKIKSISDDNKTFITFRNNCDENDKRRCTLNQWYEDTCDCLWLSIKLEHNCNLDDLRFCYCVEDSIIENNNIKKNYRFEERNIKVRKIFIENKQKEILTFICNTFCILLIITIISGEILIINDIYYECKRKIKRKRGK